MLFVEYPKCGTCRKAKKWLDDRGIACEDRNIKEDNPTEAELRLWREKSGIEPRKFFNTSGLLYKSMNLKDRLSGMTEDEMFSLLASDGMLVKRPVLVTDHAVLVGFREADWEKALGAERSE